MCHLSQDSRMKRNQLCGGLEYTLWTEKTASTMSMSIEYLSQSHNPQKNLCGLEEDRVLFSIARK